MARSKNTATGESGGKQKTAPGVNLENAEGVQPVRRVGRRRAAGPSRGRLAANDDVPSIGGLLFALNQQPSKRPFFYAAVASGIWMLVGGLLVLAFVGDELARVGSMSALLSRPATIAVAATAIFPVTLFWAFALIAWRAQELKLMSSAMTEVAVRLAEPDKLAEQSVASLGQTVRRQVTAMNDAISRALGRAGELEALVHNEVAALERSYSDNELRIRSLIEELASERDALANNSDRVSEVLRGIGAQVSHDIAGASDQAARSLTDATGNLAVEIERAGQQLTTSLKEASEQTAHVVSDKGNVLLGSLNDINQRIGAEVPNLLDKLSGEQTRLTKIVEGAGRNLAALETALAQRTGSLENTLTVRTQELEGVLETYTGSVDETMGRRLEELETRISSKARALDSAIGEKMEHFDSSLSEKAKTFYQSLNQAGMEMEQAIVERTAAIDEAFNKRTEALRSAMQNHAHVIRSSLEKQSQDLDQTLIHGIRTVQESNENISAQSIKTIEGLAGQSAQLKEVSEGILGQIHELTSRFENQGQAITKAAHALESSNYRIDSTLEARHADLSGLLDSISDRAQAFDEMMRGHSANLDETINRVESKANAVSRSLAVDTERTSQAAVAELQKLRTVTQTEAERTLNDLRNRFTNVGKEVSDRLAELDGKVSLTTEDVRSRTERAAQDLEELRQRLETEAHNLPSAAKASTDAMRQAVQNQIKALETLSEYTGEQVAAQDVTPAQGTEPDGLPSGATTLKHQPAPRQVALASSEHKLAQSAGNRVVQPDPTAASIASHLIAESKTTSQKTSAVRVLQPTEDERERWSLGDLLARASEDEEATRRDTDAATQKTSKEGSLPPANLLDIEKIARAMDPGTAAEIWTRFKRGERNTIDRNIYSAGAQGAFDEICARYRTEPPFRNTVNRYLLDFEQLLRQADHKDSDGQLLQRYLLSETGRVYLMLAHASGRLN